MSIIDLINHVGLEHTRVQPLMKSVTGATKGKHGTRVTFLTDAISPNDLIGDPRTVGLILWFPKDRLPK